MMRRGPLATNSIESLLETASSERTNGIIEIHGEADGAVYFVEGEVYLADISGEIPLEARMVAAGALTLAQVEAHTEPGDEGMYLAFALDTDETINEEAIGAFLFETTANAISKFFDQDQGEYELDPYGTHPIGILMSWSSSEVLERAHAIREEAAQHEAERLAEIERAAEAERQAEEERLAALAEAEAAEAKRLAEVAQAEQHEAEQAAADAAAIEAEKEEAERPPIALGAVPEPETTEPVKEPVAEPVSEPASEAPPVVDISTLVVTSDEPPAGVDVIELQPLEWRVVVLAAQGASLKDIAKRLEIDVEALQQLVAHLCERNLLATVG